MIKSLVYIKPFFIFKLEILILKKIKEMDTKIHKTDGKYKTQNRLISFITSVLKAEIMDCIKIAEVIARIIV